MLGCKFTVSVMLFCVMTQTLSSLVTELFLEAIVDYFPGTYSKHEFNCNDAK